MAEAHRQRELLAAQAQLRVRAGPPLRRLADLPTVWLQAEHDGKPPPRQHDWIAAARLRTCWPPERRVGSVHG